jgi:hypothetical protein
MLKELLKTFCAGLIPIGLIAVLVALIVNFPVAIPILGGVVAVLVAGVFVRGAVLEYHEKDEGGW